MSTNNTSGTQVATVDKLSLGSLEKFYAYTHTLAVNIDKVIKGDADLASLDYAWRGGSDVISDATMEEIARRLIVTVERESAGNVILAPLAPTDKSKVWWQTDAVTGIPIGQPKIWNSTSDTWVDVQTAAQTYVPPKKRHTMIFATGPGQSQVTAEFESMGTKNYKVTLTPTTYMNGSWQPAPATFPTHAGVTLINKGESELTVAFYGTPDDGLNWEVDIEERI